MLAAARATRVEDFAAADRRRAGAEAVPALANELARLISPLHVFDSNGEIGFGGACAAGDKPTRTSRAALRKGEPRTSRENS
jgi:hypothetical protein